MASPTANVLALDIHGGHLKDSGIVLCRIHGGFNVKLSTTNKETSKLELPGIDSLVDAERGIDSAVRSDSSGIVCEIGRGVVERSRLPAPPADASPRQDRGRRPTAETTGREQCVAPYHWTRHLPAGTNRRIPVGVPVHRSFDADRRATATDPRARSPLSPIIAFPGGVARPNGQSRGSRRSETLPTLFVYQCRLLDTTARRRVGPRGRRAGSTGPWPRRASGRRWPGRAGRKFCHEYHPERLSSGFATSP